MARKSKEVEPIDDVFDEDYVPTIIIPPIEEEIALPKNAQDAMPNLTREEELQVRAATIKMISDMQGTELTPTVVDEIKAQEIAKEMMTNPEHKPDYSLYPNETIAFLAGMVGQMNAKIVDDLADLKLYVVNNLIKIAETAKDDKSKLTALTKLGEVDGVDAFKKRSEMTVKHQSIEEVENELLTTLKNIKGRVIDAEYQEINREDNEING